MADVQATTTITCEELNNLYLTDVLNKEEQQSKIIINLFKSQILKENLRGNKTYTMKLNNIKSLEYLDSLVKLLRNTFIDSDISNNKDITKPEITIMWDNKKM